MTSLEKNLLVSIDKHRRLLFLVIAAVIGLLIRWAGRDFVSLDMRDALLPWFDQIKAAGGLSALSGQVGDYGLFYQTLISLMTYVDIPAIYQYKLLSVVFDAALAVMAALLYKDLKLNGWSGKDQVAVLSREARELLLTRTVLVGAVVWLLPTVMLNSAYWGQCDSMYSFFCLATLYWLRKDKFIWAFVFLGLAFSCKLQTVFIVPFIAVYYLITKRFSVAYILISLAVMWLMGVAAFAYGRSLLAPLQIYYGQSSHYQLLYLSFPSFWVLLGDDYWGFRWYAIFFTLCVVVAGMYACLNHRRFVNSNVNYCGVAAWFIWSMVLFLPCMHDRYAYLLDIMLVLLACFDRRFLKYAAVAVLTSLYFYGCFLFEQRDEAPILASVVYLIAYLHFTGTIYARLKNTDEQPLKP